MTILKNDSNFIKFGSIIISLALSILILTLIKKKVIKKDIHFLRSVRMLIVGILCAASFILVLEKFVNKANLWINNFESDCSKY